MMTRDRAQTRRVPLAVTVLVAAGFGIVGLSTPSSANHQTVTAVRGSAYGYFADVTIFGERTTTGPTPIVNLPPGGSATPIEATAATGRAVAGPGGIATVFSSGPITVRTQGTTGPSGSVTSSARIQNVNTSRNEVFTASEVLGTCTASEAGTSGSTTITGGTLQTDNGDSDTSNTVPDHPATTVNVPANPAPNTAITGHVHIGTAQDDFRYVFNEQIVNPDGSITVNAAHQYLGINPPDNATGDLIIGHVECGVTLQAAPTTTTPTTTTPTTTTPTTTTPTTTTPTTTTPTTTTPTTTTPTTTTLPGGSGFCAQLLQQRAQFNAQMDQMIASVRALGPFADPFIASIEQARAAGNASFDQVLAVAGCTVALATVTG